MHYCGLLILVVCILPVTKCQEFNCTFEAGICGWTQSQTDDFDLILDSDGTPSLHTGPSEDHTFGDSLGVYLYLEGSGRSAQDKAVLLSPEVPGTTEQQSWCFSFWYNMFGRSIDCINVFAYLTSSGNDISTKTPVFSVCGRQTGDKAWMQALVNISGLDAGFTVAMEVIRGDSSQSDIAIDDLSIWQDECPSPLLSFNCSFEQGPCGWTQSNDDDYNLALQREDTLSSETGPEFDHTFGDYSGTYLYLEGSNGNARYRAVLLSPEVRGTAEQQSWCFSFWYNMFGRHIDCINVFAYLTSSGNDISTKTPVFSVCGRQTGDKAWMQALVNISGLDAGFIVAMEVIRGDGSKSDTAIDDLSIRQDECPSKRAVDA
ncbi:MAM and LDL-receptor class A domain-containing protein 1-like [Acanthaster planci]|uniref:MAM and LDL-receptor class A domain-containing protein 1-like n=1 Tax=Acanthaster planci TaxID=133434 RepID=A0A8B7ZF41_ACAPL|nr:MAM and LDL-receptor class A domain-containing protein 1-like [Acanthaster planci]